MSHGENESYISPTSSNSVDKCPVETTWRKQDYNSYACIDMLYSNNCAMLYSVSCDWFLFFQCNRLLRWCPAPDCGHAVKVQYFDTKPVTCKCGHTFW